MTDELNIKSTTMPPRWVEFRRNGDDVMWLDMIDGKFAYGGTLAPTAGARLFMDELGKLLDERVQDAAEKLANQRGET